MTSTSLSAASRSRSSRRRRSRCACRRRWPRARAARARALARAPRRRRWPFAAQPLLHASLPTTTAVADIVDNVAAFADSPAILLLPIGAGAVVAGLIIFVLVKAAG